MLFYVLYLVLFICFFFFKQKTAYEMRISDWSSDVCSSDLRYRCSWSAATRKAWAKRRGSIRIAGEARGIAADIGNDRRGRRREPRSEERRVGKECVSTC